MVFSGLRGTSEGIWNVVELNQALLGGGQGLLGAVKISSVPGEREFIGLQEFSYFSQTIQCYVTTLY